MAAARPRPPISMRLWSWFAGWGCGGMKLFPSLDAKDRRLLIGCMVAVVVLAFVTAFLSRNENDDDNPVPSSYLTGKHGARAAYEMLQASGYNVQRWEQPLSDLAERADGTDGRHLRRARSGLTSRRKI